MGVLPVQKKISSPSNFVPMCGATEARFILPLISTILYTTEVSLQTFPFKPASSSVS